MYIVRQNCYPGSWGAGLTLDEALKNLQKHTSFRKKETVTVAFGDTLKRVNDFGYFVHEGDAIFMACEWISTNRLVLKEVGVGNREVS